MVADVGGRSSVGGRCCHVRDTLEGNRKSFALKLFLENDNNEHR